MALRLLISLALTIGFVGLGPVVAQTSLQKSLDKQLGKDTQKKAEPEAVKRTQIRFLLDDDYPPFNYLDEDRVLTGFNVDIARAICLELSVSCTFVTKTWDALVPALIGGEGDAIISSLKITESALQKMDFTDRYYFTPARFVVLRKSSLGAMTPEGLEARTVAVVAGSAHEAYVKAFFIDSRVRAFATLSEARAALVAKQVDVLFGDGISHAFWLTGTASKACCEFRGDAFFEPKYFGDGVGIAVRKGDLALRQEINSALKAVRSNGRYEELFLRSFPVKVY